MSDAWKVGDRLQLKKDFAYWSCGDVVEVEAVGPGGWRTNSDPSRYSYCLVDDNNRRSRIYDCSDDDNPSTYFFWLGPPSAPWSVGDRVERVADAEISPKGTLGTVTEVTDKDIAVQWDHLSGSIYYQTPINPSLFVKISTGQSTRPVLHCERCGEYNEWAEPNTTQSTYRCYQCRKDRFR